MSLSGNKGEWSELYTLFKLLADGKLFAGDADPPAVFAFFQLHEDAKNKFLCP
ncbi:HpaII family restriction endonuclease [Olivibacter sitiensis]|uniref:HpaII family restriction endonuclease n=1 Tax=Olivibacter sitiensis TaxID=376470 RepID=UPI00040325E6|nr:HpaII family restriction endonuclease [Olivibacter sitiensis]